MKPKILWADDEIDLLKPYVLFLEQKGYEITPVPSGADALDKVESSSFDLIFLDEMMPGMTGLETLSRIKQIRPNVPVVMITKSEEERIMEQAIGSKIADYLIKPLNPNQILLSVKKILDNRRLVSETTNQGYQQDFRNLAMQYSDRIGHEEWTEIYKKLIFWELEIDKSEDKSMEEVFNMQKAEANSNFCSFIEDNYEDWFTDPRADKPLLSHQLLKKKVLPYVGQDKPTFFILIDNFRYDQWKSVAELIEPYFSIEEESSYYSILPTATSYARNAIFAGLTPLEISKQYPKMWVNDEGENEDAMNNHESDFLKLQIEKNRLNFTHSYHKIITTNQGKNLVDGFNNLLKFNLVAVVFNFVDMLSHARTDMAVVKELAPDESAYRSITKSWIQHAPLFEFLKKISAAGCNVVLTTDHGMIRVKEPVRILGDKNVNTNLRYKQGRNLNYDTKAVFTIKEPEKVGLPKINVSTSYVFTRENQFFAYPNNYNHYVSHYKDTFQHGGISLEEVIIPVVKLKAK